MDEKSMAEGILKPLDDRVNRNAKDNVFCDLLQCIWSVILTSSQEIVHLLP